MKKLLVVVGTRPNYIKVTCLKKLARNFYQDKFDVKIIHTGQHFSKEMTDVFFQQLELYPDYFLNIAPLSPNTQIAEIMVRLEQIFFDYKPDCIIVAGDVNSTLAASLCANKCGFKVAHIESGLRSFDLSMPEEINRIITDQLSNLFFVTEQSGIDNLLKENKKSDSIFFVGNTMIDTLVSFDEQIRNQNTLTNLGVESKLYILVTMHRPATVDNPDGLKLLCELLDAVSCKLPIVFPVHPRTKKKLMEYELWESLESSKNIVLSEPLNYFDFQNLVLHCKLVLTDSGGIQEETTYRRVPCLTLRPNTERPITVSEGTNTLVSFSISEVLNEIDNIVHGNYKEGTIPLLWDGKASARILEILQRSL